MKTTESEEIVKIAGFLSVTSRFIQDVVKRLLVSCGCEVVVHDDALDSFYEVIRGDKSAVFYFHNLYLEIATIDRDAEQPQFDERLHDYEYFLMKTSRVIRSKLWILLKLLMSEDTDKAIEEVFKGFDGERIMVRKIHGTNDLKGGNDESG